MPFLLRPTNDRNHLGWDTFLLLIAFNIITKHRWDENDPKLICSKEREQEGERERWDRETYHLSKDTESALWERVELLLLWGQAQPHVDPDLHRNLEPLVLVHGVLGYRKAQDTHMSHTFQYLNLEIGYANISLCAVMKHGIIFIIFVWLVHVRRT